MLSVFNLTQLDDVNQQLDRESMLRLNVEKANRQLQQGGYSKPFIVNGLDLHGEKNPVT